MLLKKIIRTSSKNIGQINILDLSLDSRKVKKGCLFFALKGSKTDGEKFIKEAIQKGAVVIVCSFKSSFTHASTPIIKVQNIEEILATACKNFFNKKPKNIIAITGTNGKTSVADFFYQILSLINIPVATIGTLGIKKKNKIKKINLTSPDIITLHKELELIKKEGINNVAIEASSHGLKQSRLNGINFKAGIFTNFSQDHLDYHGTMRNYLAAKLILFKKLLDNKNFLITDSNIKEFSILKKIARKKKIKVLTINESKIWPQTLLIGSFQKKNFKMATLAASLCGITIRKIALISKKIQYVNGRLELVRTLPNKTKIFIDYAHTPDALLTAIQSLKNHHNNNVTLVFGCGGQRDIKKRAIMARIADKYCEKIYVTDDNPRNENPKKIRSSIIKHLKRNKHIQIANRKTAIELSIKNALAFDVILIAGKGHENYQVYKDKIIKISDKNIVNNTKINKKNYKKKYLNYLWNSKIINKIINKKLNYNFHGVSINSKEVKKNNLFIAIKGPKNNGHDYLPEAITNGAKFCLVSKKIKSIDKKKLIIFNNTKTFLNKIASVKRSSSCAKIIAITGSSGKTTLKEMLGSLLNTYEDTFYSPKSYNNHYGVPLSLANLEKNHKYGVFEIGMSNPGEINTLSKIVRPNIAVITNVAAAHIENFKSIEEIAKTKAEIIQNIKKGGKLIINKDDKYYNFFNNIAKNRKIETISYGITKKSDVFPVFVKKEKKYNLIKVKVLDEYLLLKIKNINIHNVLSTLAVLKMLKLNLNKVIKPFKSIELIEGRGKTHIIQRYNARFKLIDESYNANPFSVNNAIFNLSRIKKNNFKKYLLLGDMLELGKNSDSFHRNLSKIINNTDIDKIFVYGDKILNAYRFINKKKQGNILQHINDFDEIFSAIIRKNDYLMIKGSNATGLNKIARSIIEGVAHVI